VSNELESAKISGFEDPDVFLRRSATARNCSPQCAPQQQIACTQGNRTNRPFPRNSKDIMDQVVSVTHAGDPTANAPALSLQVRLHLTL